MVEILENCVKNTKQSIITLKEKRAKIYLRNSKQHSIKIITVDGCLPFTGARCDFLIISSTDYCFIELKGSDISHALQQIKATMAEIEMDETMRKNAIVVFVANAFRDSAMNRHILNFKRKLNTSLRFCKTGSKFDI